MLAPRFFALVLCAAFASCIDIVGLRVDWPSYALDRSAWDALPCPDMDEDGVQDVVIAATPTEEGGTRAVLAVVSSRTLRPLAALASDAFTGEAFAITACRRTSTSERGAGALEGFVLRVHDDDSFLAGPPVDLVDPRWRRAVDSRPYESFPSSDEETSTRTRRPGDDAWCQTWTPSEPSEDREELDALPSWIGMEAWAGDVDGDGRLDRLVFDDERTVSIRSGTSERVVRTIVFDADHFVTAATGHRRLARLVERGVEYEDELATARDRSAREDEYARDVLASRAAGDVDRDGVADFVFGCQLSESRTAHGPRAVRLGVVSIVSGVDGRVLVTRTIDELAQLVDALRDVVRLPVAPLAPIDPDRYAFDGDDARSESTPPPQVRPDPWDG